MLRTLALYHAKFHIQVPNHCKSPIKSGTFLLILYLLLPPSKFNMLTKSLVKKLFNIKENLNNCRNQEIILNTLSLQGQTVLEEMASCLL